MPPNPKQKILIIEDNEVTRFFLVRLLESYFEVLAAENAILGIEFARNSNPDLILLDIMLPHLSGIDACGMLKKDQRTKQIPIIFLSSQSKISDVTKGLDIGADDYVTKPFDQKELISRIKARLRGKEQNTPLIIIGDLSIDPSAREVKFKNRKIKLTLTEFDILRLIISKSGTIVSREDIIDSVHKASKKEINNRTVDVHIRAIRKKIPEIQKFLTSIYGSGYKFEI